MTAVTFTEREIRKQPDLWERALDQSRELVELFPVKPGASLAFVGSGTSYYVGLMAAGYFEDLGICPSRAVPASVYRPRPDESVVVISRSGTTTEALEAAEHARAAGRTVLGITGDPESPLPELCHMTLALSYVREESVVQTGSATTAMMVLRAAADRLSGRTPPHHLPRLLEEVLQEPVEALTAHSHAVVLGSGWRYGVACEAALKLQEMAHLWVERYVPLEYRHGPLSLAGAHTHVEILDPETPRISALARDIRATGAKVRVAHRDPLVELVRLQRVALLTALARNLNPDRPAHLTRSITLTEPAGRPDWKGGDASAPHR
ncbi:MAG: SIS domain-containing protein [Firmicutes bacterium]|nr:SIS domain-containing protein [Bacillota bacterium]